MLKAQSSGPVAGLSIENLRKTFGSTVALQGIDLEIEAGEVSCLLGPNGAGKSTIVSIVGGWLKPDSGRVLLNGIDIRKDPQLARNLIGVAEQELAVYPTLSVRENVHYAIQLAGFRTAARQMADDVLERLNLVSLGDVQVRRLSGGQKRLLHIAMALAKQPAFVVLDEPTAHLDPAVRDELLTLVKELIDNGAAVCYSTHNLEEVEVLEGSVVVLHRGRIVLHGKYSEIVKSHGPGHLRLRFNGRPPALAGSHREGTNDLVIPHECPAGQIHSTISMLGEDAHRLVFVAVEQSTLRNVFRKLTSEAACDIEPDPSAVESLHVVL
jgi:ABC-2 type transport system ATP-binding protein